MSEIYFTSDWHLNHAFVAKTRGYDDVDEHDIAIMESMLHLNKRDMLWVLGDIIWGDHGWKVMDMLDPRIRKHAVLGNHDKFSTEHYLEHFVTVQGAVKYKGLWLTHIPIHPQEIFRAKANVHGHIHEFGHTDNIGPPYINVNWDFWKRPVSLTEIKEQIDGWAA